MALLAFFQPVATTAEPLTLCIEIPPRVTGASAIDARFRDALLGLDFANVKELKLPQCDDPKVARLRGLRIQRRGANLVVDGEFYRPSAAKMDLGPVSCADCSASEDGVEQALGSFLNMTLFDWRSRLLGGFRIESCASQKSVLQATLTLLGRSNVSKLETLSYGFGELSWLDKNKVELLKPVPIALDLYNSPSEIAQGKPFDATFRRNQQFTERELAGFVTRYCSNFQGKYQRLLVPVYRVSLDYEDFLLSQTSAPFVRTSSSLTPSRSAPK